MNKYNAKGQWVCSECWRVLLSKDSSCHEHKDSKPVYFHSTGELKRWHHLLLMQKNGEIVNLKRQVRFKLEINGILVTTYTPDFVYVTPFEEVVEDFKGQDTDASKLRRKLMKVVHGIDVLITKR